MPVNPSVLLSPRMTQSIIKEGHFKSQAAPAVMKHLDLNIEQPNQIQTKDKT